jgi:hypothetical protein
MSAGSSTRQSFGNSVWSPTDIQTTEGEKVFEQVDATITLYENDWYDDYVAWLSDGAYGMVTDISPFTSSDLTGF